MNELTLDNTTWVVEGMIGRGGFGRVFAVTNEETHAVAKLVEKFPGASRELLFVDLRDVRNVVPVIQSGEVDNDFVLIMPRADMSLQDHLEANGISDLSTSIGILQDIAETLTDLDGKVVHRDLKPDNVLLFEGKWCLADFGIARYAEATTALHTQKNALSPQYAAPERWLFERATSKTDIYSLGVMMYQLMTGVLPFSGTVEELREQHLRSAPAPVGNIPPLLESLCIECMYKAPEARPSARTFLQRLIGASTAGSQSPGRVRLAEVNLETARQRAEALREETAQNIELSRRAGLGEVATTQFQAILDSVTEAINESAPEAQQGDGRNNEDRVWKIRQGQLRISKLETGVGSHVHLDVIAAAEVEASPDVTRAAGSYARSHSLWYCDAKEEGNYGWFETAFMTNPLMARTRVDAPFALAPGSPDAGEALGPGLGTHQVAWPFTLLDPEGVDDFVDRWLSLFADAAVGQLRIPSSMPERPVDGSWRRA